ncbi:hypothetical protein LR48_Vigan05g086600 [Vigna angularis]|uniref:Uncharacterized protein n=1 Tax=Phaseolus angularis TaxID=3914 RepID=A0A0L9UL10_PHAAN|nr:hypothetical protein LR48_Vigan05g086600 [Vigna angularis]
MRRCSGSNQIKRSGAQGASYFKRHESHYHTCPAINGHNNHYLSFSRPFQDFAFQTLHASKVVRAWGLVYYMVWMIGAIQYMVRTIGTIQYGPSTESGQYNRKEPIGRQLVALMCNKDVGHRLPCFFFIREWFEIDMLDHEWFEIDTLDHEWQAGVDTSVPPFERPRKAIDEAYYRQYCGGEDAAQPVPPRHARREREPAQSRTSADANPIISFLVGLGLLNVGLGCLVPGWVCFVSGCVVLCWIGLVMPRLFLVELCCLDQAVLDLDFKV